MNIVREEIVGEEYSRDELLHMWLSAAESQICSLEVLCTQIPKMNILLEENMVALGDSFSTLASQAQSQSLNVNNIISAAENISVDDKKTTVTNELKMVLAQLKGGETDQSIDAISKIIESVEQQSNNFSAAAKIAEVSASQMVSAVSNAIVGMQFQDRVAQNLVIAENVAKENVKHLKENIDVSLKKYKSDKGFGEGKERADIDIEFAKRLISLLTLGELQHQFVDHLVAHGYIENGEVVGFCDNVTQNSANEVELF